MKRKTVLCLMAILLLGVTGLSVSAQEAGASKKGELVKELIALMGVRDNANRSLEAMQSEMEKQYPQMIRTMVERDATLTPERKQQMISEMIESRKRFSDTLHERLNKRIDMGALMEEINYSLYDKYFTEGEIRDLLSFYKTETGKKAAKVTSELARETFQRMQEKLIPIIGPLVMEIMNEEKERMRRK